MDKKQQDKQNRKAARKWTKFANIIREDLSLTVSQVPSKWLVVWGFGLSHGSVKEEVSTLFRCPEEIRFLYDKSYCFLRYADAEKAAEVKAFFEGQATQDGQSSAQSFVAFLSEEPPEEDSKLVESFREEECPPGLVIIPNFVTEEEQDLILLRIREDKDKLSQAESEKDTVSSKVLRHRWVRHFGYEFRYGRNDVDINDPLKNDPMPGYLDGVLRRMVEKDVFKEQPEQLTVNEYSVGQGIPPHVDTHSCFESPIVSLSLGSEVVMNFRRGERLFSAILPNRSLLVMNGEARLGWTHGIANRTWDIVPSSMGVNVLRRRSRVSLTFRRLTRNPGCCCLYPEMCDSQKGKISEDNAPSLEEQMVHSVYERIAPHFHETRHTPWPRVKAFIESVGEGGVILDVGCGNGKYFHLNDKAVQIGSDMSNGLLEICRARSCEVLRSNALLIPFQDCTFDAVICIAVLHHISTRERRLAAINEIARILRKGGLALIYVWSKNQEHEDKESVYASHQKSQKTSAKPQIDPCDAKTTDFAFLPIHDKETNFTQNDVLVPWVNAKDKENPVHHRYYHVFNEGELEELIEELSPLVKVIDSYYDQGNWVSTIQKL